MQPDYNLRIRSMAKALAETIIPAIDSNNRSALEQAHIVLGTLELLRQQIDYAHMFEQVDIRAIAALARNVAAAAGGAEELEQAADAAIAVSTRGSTLISELKTANRELRAVLSRTIEAAYADGDDGKIASVQSAVIAGSKEQIGVERAFVAATNFDVFPDDLKSLEEALLPSS